MNAIAARLKRLEGLVLATENQREYERLTRLHYNLFQVSDGALIESLLSTLEGSKPQEWVIEEFCEPIPRGGDRARIIEANEWAGQVLCDTGVSEVTDVELTSRMTAVLSRFGPSCIERVDNYLQRLRRLGIEPESGMD